MKNALGRLIPDSAAGYGPLVPFAGAFATKPSGWRAQARLKTARAGRSKVLPSLAAAFEAASISDGMTLSFHHHLRNGDGVLNMVLATAERLGIRDLTVAISSVFPVHDPLIAHMQAGTVSALDATFIAGPVGLAISMGILDKPVVMRTHGGRARAIESGQLKIDVAFIAASAADDYGNLNGVIGPTACGPLGYAYPDAQYADVVVAVTDTLCPYPLSPISIPQTLVDHVVVVDSIGDAQGIAFGSTRLTRNPVDHEIARSAAEVIRASGLLKAGFSFQTGAGGASLASASYVRQFMRDGGITGSFALGGITSYMVKMLDEGLFRTLIDVQSFDLDAVRSLASNPNHVEVGASQYANPFTAGCAVDKLDAVVLGATEIDLDFNVNVVTGSTGVIMGGSGGHADAAAGASLTIIAAKLVRKRLPTVVESALTATTPGETVDVLVTERGVAVNPGRPDLTERLQAAGLPLKSIEELHDAALSLTGKPDPVALNEKVVAVVEYRDGTVIDVVRQAPAH
jgi:citrate lyase subunit alpha/citrate CoA-transferase